MLAFPFIYFIEMIISSFIVTPRSADCTGLSETLCVINIIITFILLAQSLKKEYLPNIRSYINLGFMLRLGVLLWDYYMSGVFALPNSDGDAIFYPNKAVSYAFGSRQGIVSYTDFPYYVSLMYRIMGNQKLNVQFLHVYYAVCAILLINEILRMLEIDDSIRGKAILLVCFLPNTAMIDSFFLYESPLSFLVILSLYFYTKWWREYRFSFFILSILASAAAGMLHMGGIAIAVGLMVSYPIVKNTDRQPRINIGTIVLVGVMAAVAVLLLVTFGDTFLRKIDGNLDVNHIQERAALYEGGGSGYSAGASTGGGLGSFLANTPIRFVSFICAPFPWQWRGLPDILAFIGGSTFFIYVWLLILGTLRDRQNLTFFNLQYECNFGYILVLIVVAAIVGVMFGWGVSNAGSALRHREKYTYVYIVLYACIKNIRYHRLAGFYEDS